MDIEAITTRTTESQMEYDIYLYAYAYYRNGIEMLICMINLEDNAAPRTDMYRMINHVALLGIHHMHASKLKLE